jgi:hypothetical protein
VRARLVRKTADSAVCLISEEGDDDILIARRQGVPVRYEDKADHLIRSIYLKVTLPTAVSHPGR